MAAFVYEGVVLFSIFVLTVFALMAIGGLRSIATGHQAALDGRLELAVFFLVLGLYFSWFWSKSGQTLAMKTWRIRLVSVTGHRLTRSQALLRYVAAYIWFVPGLALADIVNGRSGAHILVLSVFWVIGYALLVFFQPQRQFWHDILCGTRLVSAEDHASTQSKA